MLPLIRARQRICIELLYFSSLASLERAHTHATLCGISARTLYIFSKQAPVFVCVVVLGLIVHVCVCTLLRCTLLHARSHAAYQSR